MSADSAPVTWDSVLENAGSGPLKSFYLRPGEKPATSSTAPLPASPNPTSDKPVVLYRDANAWCPFCQKVWMALLEKDIDFDSIIIDLSNRPDWYKNVIASNQTPAARINGEFVGESDDIMLRLEKDFADSPTLLPGDHEAEIRDFLKDFKTKSFTVFASGRAGTQLTEKQEETVSNARKLLDSLEQLLEKTGGPFLFGEFSLADITVAPSLPRLLHSPRSDINFSQHPRVAAFVKALHARPSMQATRVDDHTWRTLSKRPFAGLAPAPVAELKVSDAEHKARCEAAAKLATNREVIKKRLVSHSGIVRPPDSPFGETHANGDSSTEAFEAEVDRAMLRVCTTLLTGDVGSSPPSKDAVAVQVAALAYFRNLGTSPRDMSAPAMEQLRAACDAVIQAAYEFPETKLGPESTKD